MNGNQGRSQRLYHVEAHQIKILKNQELRGTWPSYLCFRIANNKGADQTMQMCSLVCAFVVRKQQSQGRGGCDAEAQASWPPLGYAPGNIEIIS